MAGRGSLSGLMPYKDANAVVLEMADEVIPVRFSLRAEFLA
jgi:predicted TIM-barrel enzyme